jgi:hypothetical protein
MKSSQPLYTVLIGFNYGKDNKRHEAGERSISLPAKVAANLLALDTPAISLQPQDETSQPEGVQN